MFSADFPIVADDAFPLDTRCLWDAVACLEELVSLTWIDVQPIIVEFRALVR